jgi:hypothetical protein
MITHIVFFKFANKSPELVDGLVQLLNNMDGKVDYLRHIEVGLDVRHTERSYDVALVTKFDTITDLQTYGTHEAHLPVLEYMRKHNIKTVIVDYES